MVLRATRMRWPPGPGVVECGSDDQRFGAIAALWALGARVWLVGLGGHVVLFAETSDGVTRMVVPEPVGI